MLESTKEICNKTLIHFLASTGCRVGVVPELKLRHLIRMRDCITVTFYEDTREEYPSFLTSEVSKVLDRYFAKRRNYVEQLMQNLPVFRARYTIKGQDSSRCCAGIRISCIACPKSSLSENTWWQDSGTIWQTDQSRILQTLHHCSEIKRKDNCCICWTVSWTHGILWCEWTQHYIRWQLSKTATWESLVVFWVAVHDLTYASGKASAL